HQPSPRAAGARAGDALLEDRRHERLGVGEAPPDAQACAGLEPTDVTLGPGKLFGGGVVGGCAAREAGEGPRRSLSPILGVAGSPSLGPRQRERLLSKLGPEVRAVASDERSQARNRELALQRLRERIAGALHIDKPRTATRPTRASKERRLADKKRQSER